MRSKLFLSLAMLFISATALCQALTEKSLAGKWVPSALKTPSGNVELTVEALTPVYGKDIAVGIAEMKRSVYLFQKNGYELGTGNTEKGKFEIIMAGKKLLFTNGQTKKFTEASAWFENGFLVMQTVLEDGAKQTVYYKKAE
ncbi:MAG TPA: hypothetical protein VHL77_05685 [Ferruginibacter sp.]|jgi:hypothetical protein|nr:hypothetical protein [Ferruginibacter sp.]